MLKFVTSPLYKIAAALGAFALLVVSFLTFGYVKKKEGKDEVVVETLKKDLVKRKDAREAAFEEKRNIDGIPDSDLLDRLRRRSNDWGKL